MLTSEIITLWRWLAYTDSTQYPDATALIDLNIVYRDMISQLNQDVNEDLFADYFYSDTVLWQTEYTLPTVSNVTYTNWLGNLLNVYVNYTEPVDWVWTVATTSGSNQIVWTWTSFLWTFAIADNIVIWANSYRVVNIADDTHLTIVAIDTELPTNTTSWLSYKSHKQDYVKVTPQRASNLIYPVEYYLTGQPKDEPFYIKFDHSIFVYPFPLASVPLWLKIHWTYDVCDLRTTDTPIIDDNWHYVLAIWLKKYIFQRLGKLVEAANAANEYILEYKKMVNTISDTELSPILREIPNLNYFQ